MARLRVSTLIEAPPAVVWAAIEDIATHVEWMEDAAAIRFDGPRQRGVGTTFLCDMKVGPIRFTDRMTIREWAPGRALGVTHDRVVSGSGRFTLQRRRRGRTRFTWEERLHFPMWLGGPVGAAAAKLVLTRMWRQSLRNLKAKVEGRQR